MRFKGWMSFAASALAFGTPALANLHVLTVGGGPEPAFDQVSLEKNVQYFQQVLDRLGAGSATQQLLFADGGTGDHTVQYIVPQDDNDRFLAKLELLSTDAANIRMPSNVRYRKTALTNIDGPATADQMNQWFKKTGASIPAGDQLLLYYTGHGGGDAASTAAPRNTTLELWDKPHMTMREFETLLDKTNAAVDVMLVMVQCHSGGFGNVIYNGGDPKNGLVKQLRYGFFSTTAPRLAAGCTPDIQGDDYREFSTAFFAALCGTTRNGQPVQKPDYGHKGVTTYMDAFTYVLLTSDTIDLPMTTSDVLLRDFSRFGRMPSTQKSTTQPATMDATLPAGVSPTSQPTAMASADSVKGLIPPTASYEQVMALASPYDKAAIEGLGKVLKLDPKNPINAARALTMKLDADSREQQTQAREMLQHFRAARDALRHAVFIKYPELRDPWLAAGLTLRDADHLPALRKSIEAMPEYAPFVDTLDKFTNLGEKGQAIEKTWVKAIRLVERANSVILAANLPLVATPEVQQRYQLLVKHETGTLTADHL